MTRRAPSADEWIAVDLWLPDRPAEKALAQPPPSDDGSWAPVELWLPDTPAADAPPPKQPRVRKPTLTHALKEADRAGRQVKGAAIYADRVEITFGEPAETPADADINEWDADLGPLPPPLRQ
jgi:hypothetical protein